MKILNTKNIVIVGVVAGIAVLAAYRYFQEKPATVLVQQIEARGSRMLGTRVEVGSMSVSRSDGQLSASELSVANPSGFSNANMIRIERVNAGGDIEARLIDSMTFDGVHALIEFQGTSNNFEEVGERVDRDEARARQEEAAAESDDEADEGDDGQGADEETDAGDWYFKRLAFNQIRVTARADWTDEVVEYDADDLVLEDVEGSSDEVARRAVVEFLNEVLLSAARQAGNERLRDNLQEKAEELREY